MFIGILIGIIILLIIKIRELKKPIIMQHPGWLKIDKFPITDEMMDMEKYLVTDGKRVKNGCAKYNSKGQVVFYYPETPITHWMPLPSPPDKEKQ